MGEGGGGAETMTATHEEAIVVRIDEEHAT